MNLLDLFAKITLDTDEYEQGLDEAKDKSSQLGEALKNGLVKGAKLAAALMTAPAAIGALTKATGAFGKEDAVLFALRKLKEK